TSFSRCAAVYQWVRNNLGAPVRRQRSPPGRVVAVGGARQYHLVSVCQGAPLWASGERGWVYPGVPAWGERLVYSGGLWCAAGESLGYGSAPAVHSRASASPDERPPREFPTAEQSSHRP